MQLPFKKEMESQTVKSEPRVFKNKFLDFLTLTSPMLILGVYGGITVITLTWDFIANHQNLLMTFGLFFTGVLSWSFAEYFLHRYLFHMFEHSNNVVLQKAHFFLHGYHHSHPKDAKRMFMPIPVSLFFAAGFLALFVWIMGPYGWSYWPGFVMGYVGYSCIHCFMHVKEFEGKYWNKMVRHHNLHHFKFNNRAFGISSPLWDLVFFTMPPAESRKPRDKKIVLK